MKRFDFHTVLPALVLGGIGLALILCNLPVKAWLILLGLALIGAAICILKWEGRG